MNTSRSLELAAAAIMLGAVAILALTDARGAGVGFVDAVVRLLPWPAVPLSAATLAARLTPLLPQGPPALIPRVFRKPRATQAHNPHLS